MLHKQTAGTLMYPRRTSQSDHQHAYQPACHIRVPSSRSVNRQWGQQRSAVLRNPSTLPVSRLSGCRVGAAETLAGVFDSLLH